MTDFKATRWYECPLCLESDPDGEEWAEYEVTVHVDAGEPAVMYPTDRAYPGSPPSIDYFEITDGHVFGCPHSEEEIYDALESDVYNDFEQGKFHPTANESYDPRI